MPPRNHTDTFSLYAASGARKYLNQQERGRALAAMRTLPPDRALFALCLAWTGGRVSEILAVSPSAFQIERGIVALRTLKRRRHVVREVPIPPELMAAINRHFRLGEAQRDNSRADQRLWPWSRTTAWRFVSAAIMQAGITGARACPRGCRHGFAVAALQGHVPLNIVQRWLGHARLSTTAIYASVSGAEEQELAARFWRANDNAAQSPLV